MAKGSASSGDEGAAGERMSEEEMRQLVATCGRVFTPSAPVDRMKLFAGRMREIRQISEAVNTRGRHAIMYGDRGVGKTSLANILKDLFASFEGMRIVRVNCTEQDTFRGVWLRALAEITVVVETLGDDQTGRPTRVEHTLDNFAHEVEQLGPGEVRRVLQRWSQDDFEMVVVFDEFDRLAAQERGPFADTIKDLSDHSVSTTLVLVGVATDVSGLFEEHGSIDRCLAQIPMPLMSDVELRDIVVKALSALGMTIADGAADLIVSMSQGFPHYTHLLGQEAAYSAIYRGARQISTEHMDEGIRNAMEKTQHTIKVAYHNAAQGQRKGTLFPQVLLACALAETDEMGRFSSADVRTPLCLITGEDYDIPNFSQHLDKFSNDDARGPVLDQSGTPRRFRFKFRNPLLQPYIIMKGLSDGIISGDLVQQLRQSRG